jgi:hypothetical protein
VITVNIKPSSAALLTVSPSGKVSHRRVGP